MEVQAESAELILCHALRAATDINHEIVRKAELQLIEWETHPGFILTLTRLCLGLSNENDVNLNNQLDTNVRWMAAVYLKNCVNKYWRRNSRQELSSDEKQQIRSILLAHFSDETVPQIGLQVAVLMSRIARVDCPNEWPDLLPELLKRLQVLLANYVNDTYDTNTDQKGERILLTLHHVIKALASRRTLADKRVFEELASNMYEFLLQFWDIHATKFFHQLKSDMSLAKRILERTILCARILRKLTIYGFGKPQKSSLFLRFMENLFDRLEQCLQCRHELKQLNADEQLVALLEKLILKQMKTILEFQTLHSMAFLKFLPRALHFSFNCVFYCNAYLIFTDNVINFRQFAIHCINLLKGTLTPFYQNNMRRTSKRDDEQNDQAMSNNQEMFFTEERISYLCEKIITHYFVLTQTELNLWLENPEEYAQDDLGGDSWKYALRPCVEALFLTLFSTHQTQMCAEVVKYVHKAQQMQLSSNSDFKDILLKDAIYNAAGQAALHLYGEVNFDTWFSGQLLDELKIESDHFRILRRRIIWLLGEWTAVKFSCDLRPLGYEACLHLLRPTEDISIRLAASCTLSILISDFEFTGQTFLPYLQQSFSALFDVLREAKECDTKMKVLTIMSSLVERMCNHIEPHAKNLISYLPMLWRESENNNMLRCSIMCTLEQMVKAIRDIPDLMRPFLYNVIAFSTDIKEPSHIYLIEEGLSLWLNVVENTTAMSMPLLDLCCNIMPIIEMSSENLRTVLQLVHAYILLDAEAFLERHGKVFIEFCVRMFEDIRAEGTIIIMKVLDVCLKSNGVYGLEMIGPTLPYIFRQVYLNKGIPLLMGMFLTIISRVLLISQQVFMDVIQNLQQTDALETIFDVWITQMPLVADLEKRKLFCLAFLSIFSNSAILLERFPAIMKNISDTLYEVMSEIVDDKNKADKNYTSTTPSPPSPSDQLDKSSPAQYYDSLIFDDAYNWETKFCAQDDFTVQTYHYCRCRQLAMKDPVHRISLPQYTQWQLNHLRLELGDEHYEQLLGNVRSCVLERLTRFVSLKPNLLA